MHADNDASQSVVDFANHAVELKSLCNAGVRGRCSVHLINEGITTTSSADGGVVTTIEWGLSAPSDAVRSEIGFRCSLDGGPSFNCKI